MCLGQNEEVCAGKDGKLERVHRIPRVGQLGFVFFFGGDVLNGDSSFKAEPRASLGSELCRVATCRAARVIGQIQR